MFTVRAEVEVRDGLSVRNVALFQAHAVRVERNRTEQTSDDHLWNVLLLDANGVTTESLPIGSGLDHYCMAYIMNEHGKTVDRVVARTLDERRYGLSSDGSDSRKRSYIAKA